MLSRVLLTIGLLLAAEAASAQSLSEWERRTADYPLGIELRLVAADVDDEEYLTVLGTMIPTDLAAEWRRVASPDNHVNFLAAHGGETQVKADPKLSEAWAVRREIAAKFLDLQRQAHDRRKAKIPFDDQSVEELCRQAAELDGGAENSSDPPIRVLMPAPGAENQWPQFRGPTGMGLAATAEFPRQWSATENVAWKTPLNATGNSSPIIWDDRLFVTVATKEGDRRSIRCLDRRDGTVQWDAAAPNPENVEALYWKNSFASSTPVTDGERVIAFFGNSGLLAVDFQGRQLWHCDLGKFAIVHGPGSAPVLYHDLIILIQDQTGSDSVFVAVNKQTGDIAWRQQRERSPCWSTPLVVRVGDRDELLFNGSNFVVSYDPSTGEELWRVNGSSVESVPNLLIGDGRIFSASGRNGPYLAIRPGGNGDVTPSHLVWKTKQGGAHVPSPSFYEGHLYAVNDLGIAACLNAKTGKTVWQQRLEGRFTASPVLAGDTLIVINEEGKTFLLKAAPRFELVGTNDLGETVYASPALLDGRLYFRTADHVYAIGN